MRPGTRDRGAALPNRAGAYVGTHIGGVGIHHPVSSTRAKVCSTAFNAVNAGGGAVAITAGHCGARGALWYSNAADRCWAG